MDSIGPRVPMLRASKPVPAVTLVLGLGIVALVLVAIGLIPGWNDPALTWRSAALGAFNRPFRVIVWILLGGSGAMLVVLILTARGTIATLYVVERGKGIVLASWLGSLGLSRKRLPCTQRVLISLVEEPSVNPNGLKHFRLTVASGGQSFRVRSYSAPTPDSLSGLHEHLRSRGVILTFRAQR